MEYIVAPLSSGVYAIAFNDPDTWDTGSYANIYVVKRQEQVIMIDAGMKKYREELTKALAEIGVSPAAVTHLLLTHGHIDHTGGAGLFPQAKKYIHAADLSMLPPALSVQFTPYKPGAENWMCIVEELTGFEVIHVNTHTPGSVALYDHLSQALFVGDFFCFFGEALPEGKLVAFGAECRSDSCQYVRDQAAVGGAEFNAFMTGLERLLKYSPEFFCTGHGVVLQSVIGDFLKELWQSGKSRP